MNDIDTSIIFVHIYEWYFLLECAILSSLSSMLGISICVETFCY